MTRVLIYAREYKIYLILAVVMIFASVISGIIPYFMVNRLITKYLNQSEVTIRYVILTGAFITVFLVLKSILNAIGKPVKTIEHLYVPLLYSMVKAGSELTVAALTRGLGGGKKRTYDHKVTFHLQDLFAVLIFTLLMSISFIYGR